MVALKDEDKASELAPLLSSYLCPTQREEAVPRVLTKELPPCFWILDCGLARGIIFRDPSCGVLVWQQETSGNNPCAPHICCHSHTFGKLMCEGRVGQSDSLGRRREP